MMEISVRLRNILKLEKLLDSDGLIKISELEKYSPLYFERRSNCGKATLKELQKAVLLQIEMEKSGSFIRTVEPNESEQRKIDIYKLRKSGLTLKDVGKQYGLSRERIRQICLQVERLLNHPRLRIVGLHDMENET